MSTNCIALVTAFAACAMDEDLAPLATALRECGAQVSIAAWDDVAVDWTQFDIALLRSTWDYTQRLPEFLYWVERTATQTRLINPLEVVRWNTDKHYLAELAAAGVPVVPSTFIEPGENVETRLDEFLQAHVSASPHPPSAPSPAGGGREEFEFSAPDRAGAGREEFEFVVKPAIGAGSRDAQRHGRDERDAATAHIQRLLDARRSVLLQPYLERVDEYGETALIFFDGQFSHAIRKGPLLRRGEGSTRALFAAEHITARTPSTDELRVALQTLTTIPFTQPLLYARVDLIHGADGTPCVLELELTEPSLFFAHAPGSAARLAKRCCEATTYSQYAPASTYDSLPCAGQRQPDTGVIVSVARATSSGLRMKPFIPAIALPLAALAISAWAQSGAPASPQHPSRFQHQLQKMDSNGDGKISLAEYLAAATARFDAIDPQHKGSIDATQLADSPAANERIQHRAKSIVKHLDKAGNGYVTQDEFLAAAKKRFARKDRDGDGKLTSDELGKRFDKSDTNHDGVVTLDEYLAAATALYQQFDQQGNGHVTVADIVASPRTQQRAARMAAHLIKRMDRNGDGKVSRDEYLAATKARFAKLDKNGNGFIEAGESPPRRWKHAPARSPSHD